MERWTKQRMSALQDSFVIPWDKGVNLMPKEEIIGNSSNELSQAVLVGKSLVIGLFIKATQKTSAMDAGAKTIQVLHRVGSGRKISRKKIHFSADRWQMITNTFFSPLLYKTSASSAMTVLTKINSCFHLCQSIFTQLCSAPGVFCFAPLRRCWESEITSRSQDTCWTRIHTQSHPRFAFKSSDELFCSGPAQSWHSYQVSTDWVTFPVSKKAQQTNQARHDEVPKYTNYH